jgi:hypothetical protein
MPPDAVWISPELGLVFEGVEAIRGFWEDWYGGYEDFHVGPPDIYDVGNGVVMAVIRQGGRLGTGSGNLSEDLALIYEWSNGLVVRVTMTRGEAGRSAAKRLAEERG